MESPSNKIVKVFRNAPKSLLKSSYQWQEFVVQRESQIIIENFSKYFGFICPVLHKKQLMRKRFLTRDNMASYKHLATQRSIGNVKSKNLLSCTLGLARINLLQSRLTVPCHVAHYCKLKVICLHHFVQEKAKTSPDSENSI